jgi:mannose-6-phosphate isomerase-like protein (cupin superfamily)
MLTVIKSPTVIESVGNKPKRIEEYVGRVNSDTEALSIAKMVSAAGWEEPGQTPEFDEYTLVLSGMLRLETVDGMQDVFAGQAVITPAGQWVRYSTPEEGGAEYVAICLPAFSPATVHRDS